MTEVIDPARLGRAIFEALHVEPNDELEVQKDRLDGNRIMIVRSRAEVKNQ